MTAATSTSTPVRRTPQEKGYWAEAWYEFRRDLAGMIGLAIVGVLLVAAVFAPWLAPHPPDVQFPQGLSGIGQPLGPSSTWPLGTDELGRDELSRLMFGARISLTVGIVGNILAALLAFLVGGFAGMLGARWQTAIMRAVDIVLSFPLLLLAITLLVIVSPSVLTTTAIVAVGFGAYLSRIVFSQVVSLRQREFVIAAEASGVGRGAILLRHILPHVMPALVVFSTLNVAAAVQLEATLSFVGIGIRPPTASWGNMIAGGQEYLFTTPMLLIAPGIAIMLAMVGFSLLGDGLRDALDPTLAQARRFVAVR
jgi:peptide/nickel transport system permease protein